MLMFSSLTRTCQATKTPTNCTTRKHLSWYRPNSPILWVMKSGWRDSILVRVFQSTQPACLSVLFVDWKPTNHAGSVSVIYCQSWYLPCLATGQHRCSTVTPFSQYSTLSLISLPCKRDERIINQYRLVTSSICLVFVKVTKYTYHARSWRFLHFKWGEQ